MERSVLEVSETEALLLLNWLCSVPVFLKLCAVFMNTHTYIHIHMYTHKQTIWSFSQEA